MVVMVESDVEKICNWIGSILEFGLDLIDPWIQIQDGKKTHRKGKNKEIHYLEELNVLFWVLVVSLGFFNKLIQIPNTEQTMRSFGFYQRLLLSGTPDPGHHSGRIISGCSTGQALWCFQTGTYTLRIPPPPCCLCALVQIELKCDKFGRRPQLFSL